MNGLTQAFEDFSTTVQSISAGYEVPYAEDLIEALDTMEDTSSTDTIEPEPEVVEEESIDEVDELVVDWEHVATLESSEDLEDYFEPLGFNANPNHRPATIIKKAKVHFGV